MLLLRIQVLVHMTLSLGAQFVTVSFVIIVCMPVLFLTIQLLSIFQYSIPTSTSVSKACFLTHDSISVCMLVFNQQFTKHGSTVQDVVHAHQGYQLPWLALPCVSSVFSHISWTNNLKYASEIITYHTWPPYQPVWWHVTSVVETDLGRLEPVCEQVERVSGSVSQSVSQTYKIYAHN